MGNQGQNLEEAKKEKIVLKRQFINVELRQRSAVEINKKYPLSGAFSLFQ